VIPSHRASSSLPFRLRPPLCPNTHDACAGIVVVTGPRRWSSSPSSASGDDSGGDGDDGISENDDSEGIDSDAAEDEDPARFAEKSQMLGFISDYLRREEGKESTDNDDEQGDESKIQSPQAVDDSASESTTDDKDDSQNELERRDDYLIAIPLDACHELGLELESVQRAILYHCPVLVHACIPMAATRLPLLYVSKPTVGSSSSSNNNNNNRRNDPTVPAKLQEVVQQAVQRVVFDSPTTEDENECETEVVGVQRDDGSPDVAGINADGIRPVLVPFSTLEIDGDNNQVLCTVGDASSPGGRTLSRLVRELRNDIEAHMKGWTARLPDDPAYQALSIAAPAGERKFRPRVPFVRLPNNWDGYLDPSKEYHTSDEGGNGISPILWGQWMDDAFGDAVRMREVAIYSKRRRMEQPPTTEEATYRVPDFVVPLPDGNAELDKVEKKFETYQDQRIRDAEARERLLSRDSSSRTPEAEDGSTSRELSRDAEVEIREQPALNTPLDKYDALFNRTLDRLESLYADDEVDTEGTNVEQQSTISVEDIVPASTTTTLNGRDATNKAADDSVPSEAAEESVERMRRVVESRARIETERALLSKRKQDKPPIEENPVFAKYKDGTLVPSSNSYNGESSAPRLLPPFPSNEHVVGFWRVVRSPTGFDVEEGDSSRSDNLILRVDGTTAGGPILNKETRQKASAGTWRLMPSTEATDGGDSSGPKTANLRIRLVIPPQKQRILVMQGKLERVSMSGTDLPMAPRGTFGIPALEERASRGNAAEQDMEDLVYCSGSVFMEDAVTGLNRDEIGTFTLQKLFTPTDPAQYTITIPKPVRNQD
jgi:hypothetical protein